MAAVTALFDWSAPVRTPRNASLVIRDALVPMLLWPSVLVTRRVDQDLTVIDRFVVEAALALSPMRAEDVEEVTAVPRDAIVRIAGRLAGLGLLRAEDDGYHPVAPAALTALERRAIPEYRPTHLTFAYLPQGDDLVAFAPGSGRPDPPLLQKASPAGVAPMPPEIAERNRAEFLRERISGGRVAGLPDNIVDAVAGQDLVPLVCQAYRCRGHVRSSGADVTLVLRVLDASGGQAAQCVIPGAIGQVARWAALAAQASTAGEAWRAAGGQVSAAQETATTWSYTLDGSAAEAAGRGGVALSRPAGLSIRDDDCVVSVGARFAPADPAAARVFALHHAVRAVADTQPAKLDAAALATATAEAREAFGLADAELRVAEVEGRLWKDGHYQHVYAMRSARDFAYD